MEKPKSLEPTLDQVPVDELAMSQDSTTDYLVDLALADPSRSESASPRVAKLARGLYEDLGSPDPSRSASRSRRIGGLAAAGARRNRRSRT